MVYGVWFMVYGIWLMGFGVWFMGFCKLCPARLHKALTLNHNP